MKTSCHDVCLRNNGMIGGHSAGGEDLSFVFVSMYRTETGTAIKACKSFFLPTYSVGFWGCFLRLIAIHDEDWTCVVACAHFRR